MRILDSDSNRHKIRSLRALPIGPDRLSRAVALLEDDLARLPLEVAPPPAVAAALRVYQDAAGKARDLLNLVDDAKREERAAHAADVDQAAEALREGRTPPAKLARPKAEAAIEVSEVTLEASERLLTEAHGHLLDAVREAWPVWRAALVEESEHAREKAAESFQQAREAIEQARATYTGIGRLDADVIGRNPGLAKQVQQEERAGLPWFGSTFSGGDPLARVKLDRRQIPTPNGKQRQVALATDAVVVALAEALAAVDYPAGEWAPPGDPSRETLQRQPLDLSRPWVRRAVLVRDGDGCRVCGQAGADTLAEEEEGGLVLVHARCRDREPDEKELKRRERLAKLERRGYDDQPSY